MGQRSTIKRDPALEKAVQDALKAGSTIDEILELVRDLGSDVSRSALGRYAKGYRELAERERDLAVIARSYAADFGGEENPTGKLLIQLITSMATRSMLNRTDDEEFDGKEAHYWGRAIKDIMSAANLDTDRDRKVREEERARAKAEAADAGSKAAAATGASDETIRRVKSAILGLPDA